MLVLATSLDHLGYVLSNSLNNDIERITLADTYLTQAVQIVVHSHSPIPSTTIPTASSNCEHS